MADSVVVDVKSAWLSKINWTQAIGVAASVAAVFGLDLPAETQAQIAVAITSVVAVVTWALRTFVKPSATPSQAANQ